MGEIKCNICEILNKKGITQRELAEKIGVNEVSISRYVNGERIPKVTTGIQIAQALGCSVEDLYGSNKNTEISNMIIENKFISWAYSAIDLVGKDLFFSILENVESIIKKVGMSLSDIKDKIINMSDEEFMDFIDDFTANEKIIAEKMRGVQNDKL